MTLDVATALDVNCALSSFTTIVRTLLISSSCALSDCCGEGSFDREVKSLSSVHGGPFSVCFECQSLKHESPFSFPGMTFVQRGTLHKEHHFEVLLGLS